MNYSPFPYKLTKEGNIKDGSLCAIPVFCRKNYNSKECQAHYRQMADSSVGFEKCPHGFGSDIMRIGEQKIILTCLNIERCTSRKIDKLLKPKDFAPRLTQERYEKLLADYKSLIEENLQSNERAVKLERESEDVMNKKILLENTLHEIRKLNNQLKNSVDQFSNETGKTKYNWEKINDLCKDIYSIASLLSIRFDAYDFEVNPELNTNAIEIDIPIYKRVEKIYKCFTSQILKRGLHIRLEGNSYKLFKASSILEIALFIVIENAIKYAKEKSEITIKFKENKSRLTVTFYNWGIRPEPYEIPHLTERGFRSKKIVSDKQYSGRGIGLFLLEQICKNIDVKLRIRIGDENDYSDGFRYSPFIVELTFDNMIESEI